MPVVRLRSQNRTLTGKPRFSEVSGLGSPGKGWPVETPVHFCQVCGQGYVLVDLANTSVWMAVAPWAEGMCPGSCVVVSAVPR